MFIALESKQSELLSVRIASLHLCLDLATLSETTFRQALPGRESPPLQCLQGA